jgi:hypothetical protein
MRNDCHRGPVDKSKLSKQEDERMDSIQFLFSVVRCASIDEGTRAESLVTQRLVQHPTLSDDFGPTNSRELVICLKFGIYP